MLRTSIVLCTAALTVVASPQKVECGDFRIGTVDVHADSSWVHGPFDIPELALDYAEGLALRQAFAQLWDTLAEWACDGCTIEFPHGGTAWVECPWYTDILVTYSREEYVTWDEEHQSWGACTKWEALVEAGCDDCP